MDMPPIAEDVPASCSQEESGRIEVRLATLERKTAVLAAENVALRAKCVQLESRGRRGATPELVDRDAAPVSRLDIGTRVFGTAPVASKDLPNDEELLQLRDICAREYPVLASAEGYIVGRVSLIQPGDGDREFLTQLRRGLMVVSAMRALPAPDQRRLMGYHMDNAADVLTSLGHRGKELRAGPLILACLIMKIPVSGINVDGSVICLGLNPTSGQRVDPLAWRDVLAAGKLPAQHPSRWNPVSPSLGRVTAAGVY